ncbi:hypothetical protein RhiirC2_810025 [Rhizophagus irregularis]|uniref:Uncharacterized protein n=1 Tax=Rhizophagus irregularis TaxID=588596 RepID=A0A2N1MT79_9GLOM|nr:hypothetical protein RhiirC2_810025 [Rhizophagus irregularis]
MEETLKQYITEYYRGFIGFEIEHIEDFYQASKTYKRINLGDSLRQRYIISTRRNKDRSTRRKVAKPSKKILRENPREGAANEKMNNELDSLKKRSLEDSEKIEELKKEIKKAEERIKFLENEAISQRRK